YQWPSVQDPCSQPLGAAPGGRQDRFQLSTAHSLASQAPCSVRGLLHSAGASVPCGCAGDGDSPSTDPRPAPQAAGPDCPRATGRHRAALTTLPGIREPTPANPSAPAPNK